MYNPGSYPGSYWRRTRWWYKPWTWFRPAGTWVDLTDVFYQHMKDHQMFLGVDK